MSKYIIGIDLGTTNCTVAYALANSEKAEIVQFSIPQIISSGVQGESLSLPSFIYFPLEEELSAKITTLDWSSLSTYCLGTFSKVRGAELPSRLIASAKSWLCHTGVDRRQKMLPISADEGLEPISPLEAISHFLIHLREAWDLKMAEDRFVDQHVLITVPASFDPSARQLVQEAALLAGYPEIILLEEPQAAFYSWLQIHSEDWRNQLKIGDTILVVDIGGGTTDFSLISVEGEQGNLSLNRLAVGAHLLLGGDNLDLSLAYLAKSKLEEKGNSIDDWQFQALIYACRQAKEKLMSESPPKSADITIMGRSSRLIGGSLKTTISLVECNKLIVEGFVPLVGPEERSSIERQAGFQQIGLPYAKDARISCQLAKFLSMTGESDSGTMEDFVLPTAVLFNGGTLKADALRNRLVDLLNQWAKKLKKDQIKVLTGSDYDFAVSQGAVHYGLARQGKAIRIKSGTSRSYFIGVEDAVPAVPGFSPPLKAVCIVPYGMEEGSEQDLKAQEFALVLGEQATFRFFSHATSKLANGAEPGLGTVLKNWQQELTELHPIETFLEKGEADGKTVSVKLKSHVTELGVLELWCIAADGRKWKLEFDIRKESPQLLVEKT